MVFKEITTLATTQAPTASGYTGTTGFSMPTRAQTARGDVVSGFSHRR
jgi:hypothetical protein